MSTQPRRRVLGLASLALLLVTSAWFLPIWQASLDAPQYPAGLTMYAYGNRVTGDLTEINSLNHYVGMRPFDPADVPEMQLWPVALVAAAVAVIVGLASRRRIVGRLARLYLWLMPVGTLAVIQLRLHQYGHDLDPLAAFRVDPFTPWVIGPTKVWNFMTWSRPGTGSLALLLAAVVVSFGPRLVARVGEPARPGAMAVAILPLLVLTAAPAVAAESHDHGSHGGQHGDAPRPGPVLRSPGGEPDVVVVDHPEAGDLASLLASVRDGGRLVLPAGTYSGPIIIDRPVVLEGRDLPVVLGDGAGDVITVRAPGTVIRGLAVRGSGPGPTGNPAAIRIEADDVRVEHVIVEDSYIGIAVADARDIVLVDNVLRGRAQEAIGEDGHAVSGEDQKHAASAHGTTHGRGDAIWLHDAHHVLIRGNHIEDARDGIYVSFGSDTLVDGNHVHESRYALHSMYAQALTLVENHFRDNLSGAVLMYGGEVLLLRNTVQGSHSASTGFGVLLKDVTDAQLVQNVLVDNRVGLHLDGPAGTDELTGIDANTIARNHVGVAAYSSARASFRANSFVENLVQVMPQGGSLDGIAWMGRGTGNYWSTYRGYELDDLGRGAVAHVEGGAVDRLLLRQPELSILAGSPAFRLLRSIEERWSSRTPAAIDHVPLMEPVSPPVLAMAGAAAATIVGLGLGVGLIAPAGLLLWHSRRRRTRLRRLGRATVA